MSGSQERPRITEYQPTATEIEMLAEEGLTLQELLQFNQPTEEQLEHLTFSGFEGLVHAMLRMNLRGNIRDALNQVVPYLFPEFPQQGIEEGIQEAQAHTIETVSYYLEGNPYPGKGFTRQQGELALETIRQQKWNKSNLGTCLAQVRVILDPPNPQ